MSHRHSLLRRYVGLAVVVGLTVLAVGPVNVSAAGHAATAARPVAVSGSADLLSGTGGRTLASASWCSSSRPYVTLVRWDPWLSSTSTQYGGLYIELRRSNGCQTAWAYIRQSSIGGWRGVVSVWNPGQPSQTAWSLPYGNETGMVNDGPGVQACVGVQVYYNGNWNRWLFLGCRWGS